MSTYMFGYLSFFQKNENCYYVIPRLIFGLFNKKNLLFFSLEILKGVLNNYECSGLPG